MPRGIPNTRRDDTPGMRFTSFAIPLAPNPKHVSSSYLKSESQTRWARNAAKRQKVLAPEESVSQEQRRGSNVIVIHPGSRFIRIGKASDVTPISVLNVVARKFKPPLPSPTRIEGISRPRKDKETEVDVNDDDDTPKETPDPFAEKLTAVSVSLRDRMRFYKLRVTPNATTIASTFNKQFEPEIITEHADSPFKVNWIDGTSDKEEALVGEKALCIVDPEKAGYTVRWPIHASNFNTRDYSSIQLILSDIELVIRRTLSDKLNISEREYKNFSVVLVIPDLYDRAYVREFINIFISMGFKQFCAQQESLAATYGAGISNACVVDIGATKTTVACVDEGLVIPDTRMSLNMGGDDITEFLYVLLKRINFPYRDINLSRSYDWNVMEDLKCRICTLAENDVALNLYDFVVRKPNEPTKKFGLRAYDEIILAPMCIFEPRIIEFENKRTGFRAISEGVTEEIIGSSSDYITNAMLISTQHLLPAGQPESSTTPQVGAPLNAAPTPGTSTPAKIDQDSTDMAVDISTISEPPIKEPAEPIDMNDDSKVAKEQPQPVTNHTENQPLQKIYSGGYPIDVCFEASKLPLDVAIFNSSRAAGGDEKIRKYLQAVLVIGGTALLPGMSHALESRLQAIATPLVPNMEKVQIIPPPKEVDPRVLAWKGAAVLGKMDGVSELWITQSDWDVLGMRGLKERCFFL